MTEGTEFTKRCCKCERDLALSHFSKNAKRRDGLQTACKACQAVYNAARSKRSFTNQAVIDRAAGYAARLAAPKPTPAEKQRMWREANPDKHAALRKKHYAAKYGLTPERYDEMRAEQHDRCAICLVDLPDRPHVDHDHYNGKTRALLCGSCNCGIGMLQDTPDILRRAADYIDFWSIVHDEVPSETT